MALNCCGSPQQFTCFPPMGNRRATCTHASLHACQVAAAIKSRCGDLTTACNSQHAARVWTPCHALIVLGFIPAQCQATADLRISQSAGLVCRSNQPCVVGTSVGPTVMANTVALHTAGSSSKKGLRCSVHTLAWLRVTARTRYRGSGEAAPPGMPSIPLQACDNSHKSLVCRKAGHTAGMTSALSPRR
jgi:hypothetical protein